MSKKMDWAEMEEEENRMEIKSEEIKNIKEKPTHDKDGKPAIQKETYLIRKTLLPVRRQVKDRKNWEKFGEVKHVARGEHLLGDWARENEVQIIGSQFEVGETGIISQLDNMNTEGMREKQLERKKREMEIESQLGEKPQEKKNKFDSAFATAPTAKEDYAIKVWDIYPQEREFRLVEEELKEFFDQVWERHGIKCIRSKFLSNKITQDFIGKAYFTFLDEKSTAKALHAIETVVYNSVTLQAEWAKDDARRNINPNPTIKRNY